MDVLFYLHVRQVLNFGKSDFLSLLGSRRFVLLERHLPASHHVNCGMTYFNITWRVHPDGFTISPVTL